MTSRILLRRGTAAQWASANPILGSGELGVETDTLKFKIGNGTSTWTQLTSYANITPSQLTSEINNLINAAPSTLDTLNELAAAINNDASFSTTVNNLLTGKVSKSGGDTITASTASTTGLIIKGAVSQTANLQEWQTSTGTVLGKLDKNGVLTTIDLVSGSLNATWRVYSTAGAPTVVPITAKGAASQTANLQEWQDSAGTTLALVDSTGKIRVNELQAISGYSNININSNVNSLYAASIGNIAPFTGSAMLAVSTQNGGTTAVGILVRGVSGQTGDLQQWQNNAGSVLAFVDSSGSVNTTNKLIASNILDVTQSSATATGYGTSVVGDKIALFGSTSLPYYYGFGVQNGRLVTYVDSGQAFAVRVASSSGAKSSGSDSVVLYGTGAGSFLLNSASTVGLTIKGAASQTANLTEWQNSAGTVIAKVDNLGVISSSFGLNIGSASFSGVAWNGISNPSSVTTLPTLVIKGIASQTANLQEWRDSAGAINASLSSTGDFRISNIYAITSFNNAQLNMLSTGARITTNVAANVTLTVKGATSQTADLQQWQDSSGTTLTKVMSDGTLYTPIISNTNANAYIGWGTGGNPGFVVTGGAAVPLSHFRSGNASSTPIVAKGAASQTADLQQWQNSAGSVVASIANTGSLTTGNLTLGTNGLIIDASSASPYIAFGSNTITINTRNAAYKGLIVQGAASQTANLQEWQSSSGEVGMLFNMGNAGDPSTLGFSVSRAWGIKWGAEKILSTDGGSLIVTPYTTDRKVLIVKGVASQTANLQEWQNSDGYPMVYINKDGNIITAGNVSSNYLTVGYFATIGGLYNSVALTVKGAASQTANLQEWQNSAGTVLSKIDATGNAQFAGFNVQNSATINGTIYTQAIGSTSDYAGNAISINSGKAVVMTPAAASVGLVVKSAASQTADLQQWQDSAGTVAASINSGGSLSLSRSLYTSASLGVWASVNADPQGGSTGNALTVQTYNTTSKGIVIAGQASQTANLQEWQDSTGAVLANIMSNGSLFVNSTGTANDPITIQRASATRFKVDPYGNVFASALTAGSVVNSIAGTTAGMHTGTASNIGLIIRGSASQSANLQEWQDSSGTILTRVTSSGVLGTSVGVYSPYYQGHNGVGGAIAFANATAITITPQSASVASLIVKGLASQTANLQEWQNSAGTVVASVGHGGWATFVGGGVNITGGSSLLVNSNIYSVYGTIVAGGLPDPVPAQLTSLTRAATTIGLLVRGFASQTADLQQWQNSGGTVLAEITASGSLELNGKDIELMNIMGAF